LASATTASAAILLGRLGLRRAHRGRALGRGESRLDARHLPLERGLARAAGAHAGAALLGGGADRRALLAALRRVGHELGVLGEELGQLALAGAQLLGGAGLLLLGEAGGVLGLLLADRLFLLLQQRGQARGDQVGPVPVAVAVRDAERVGAARRELDVQAEILDDVVDALLLDLAGEVELGVADDLLELAAR
jgi:hypothetical protein